MKDIKNIDELFEKLLDSYVSAETTSIYELSWNIDKELKELDKEEKQYRKMFKRLQEQALHREKQQAYYEGYKQGVQDTQK